MNCSLYLSKKRIKRNQPIFHACTATNIHLKDHYSLLSFKISKITEKEEFKFRLNDTKESYLFNACTWFKSGKHT